ncbi:MAG: DUF3124 domain-containing protein [Thermodesulfobacteriota bacterium]
MGDQGRIMAGRAGALLLLLVLWGAGAAAAAPARPAQTVYVPVFQRVVVDERGREMTLTAKLSLRNTDPARSIEVLSVAQHDSQGRLYKQHLSAPLVLAPLAVRRIRAEIIPNDRGGCFLVRWQGPAGVNPPLLQTIMLGTAGQQGISFTGEGRTLAPAR